MCKKKKKLLLTVFIVLLLIYYMFCFLHIDVNLPDSVKTSVLLGIRPPRSVQHVAIIESVRK